MPLMIAWPPWLPGSWRPAAQRWRQRLRHAGVACYCPLCRSPLRAFVAHEGGGAVRPDADCPVCRGSERHRLAWLCLRAMLASAPRPCRFLHLAPEWGLGSRIRKHRGLRYVSGDLRAACDVRLDLGRLPFADAAFDALFISHVLNVLPDDRSGIRELGRVVRPGGWAMVQIPTIEAPTEETPPDGSPAERIRRFGDANIYRRYGADAADRLAAGGFEVCRDRCFAALGQARQRRLGLRDESTFICRRVAP